MLITDVELGRALVEYKKIIELVDSFKSVVYLKYVENSTTNKGDFYKNAFEKAGILSARLTFFNAEVNTTRNISKKKTKFTQLFDLIKVGYKMLIVNIKVLSPILQMSVVVICTLLLMCVLVKLAPAFIEFIRKLLIALNTSGI